MVTLLIFAIITFDLVFYFCSCVAAGRSDRRDEEILRSKGEDDGELQHEQDV